MSARSAPGEPLRTIAYESDEWLTSLLEAHGYVKGAYLNPYLAHPLDRATPDTVVAGGFAVRESGREVELEQWAGAMNESFGGPPEPRARAINSARTFIEYCDGGQDLSLVAVSEQGVIASYALCLIDPVTKLGEFDPVWT